MSVNPDRGCLTCSYCGGDWVPEPNLDDVVVLQAADVTCPLCVVEMQQARLASRGILYCVTCRGMLIRLPDFLPIIEELRATRSASPYTGRPPSAEEFARTVACPLCAKPMENHRYGGPGNVLMDTCEICEVHWLDKGELKRIALAPDYPYAPSPGITLKPPEF